ncbi:hypothetical protein CWC03_09045, partial [Pseudoalteromonas sp. S2755]
PVLLSLRYLHPVGKANLRTNSWLLEVNSTQLALKLAARKALIIRSSGYLINAKASAYIKSRSAPWLIKSSRTIPIMSKRPAI